MEQDISNVKLNDLENRVNSQPSNNKKSINDSKTKQLIEETKKISRGEPASKSISEKVEKNKKFAESTRKVSDNKKAAYDFLSKIVGVDLYNVENRHELKRVSKTLEDVKADISDLELVLNGKEVYVLPKAHDETLVKYLSSVDPKRKGLYFKEQELKDITIMFKNKELEYNDTVAELEAEIDRINERIEGASTANRGGVVRDLKRERLNINRMIDVYNQRVNEINYEIDKYRVDLKIVQNDINEKQNYLNSGRELVFFSEQALKIIGAEHLSKNGKKMSKTVTNFNKIKEYGENFKSIMQDYMNDKQNSMGAFFDSVKNLTTNNEGEGFFDDFFNRNKAQVNNNSSNLKASRDNYFQELGY